MSKIPKFLKGIAKFAGPVIPTVARMLGGPLAGNVADQLFSALGIIDATDEEKRDVIQNPTPEQLVIMKEFDYKMASLPLEVQKVYNEDRERATSMAMKFGLRKHFILTIVMTLIFSSFVGILLYAYIGNINVSGGLEKIVYSILGSITTLVIMIYTFWFGDSDKAPSFGE